MDLERLDAEEFAGIGIRFKTAEETEAFAELIREELEVRIGAEIAKHCTEEQLAEFDRCAAQKDAQRWLEKNCPDHRKIVIRIKKEFKAEIIKHKAMISGILTEMDREAGQVDLFETDSWYDNLEDELDDDILPSLTV